ncbi:MAG: hypothetical protein JXM70_20925, partial [Pirellulales bacterium]|nr:hypothetical protein [Pirellulales bacterium]
MKNLVTLGKASATYQRDPAWIRARLHSAGVDAEITINSIEHYNAAAVEAVISNNSKGLKLMNHPETLNGVSIKAKEAALLRSANCSNATLEKHFTPETLERADSIRGYSIQEMLLDGATIAGYRGRMNVTDGNLREIIKAAFSTHSITTLLTQAGGKMLLDGFEASPRRYRYVSQSRSVPDFKQITAFRLTADLEYEQLAPGGQIEHGTASQESYTMQASTYAKLMVLTRQDIINDDLGAFDDLRRRLGMGAAMAMDRKF